MWIETLGDIVHPSVFYFITSVLSQTEWKNSFTFVSLSENNGKMDSKVAVAVGVSQIKQVFSSHSHFVQMSLFVFPCCATVERKTEFRF